MRSSRLTSRAQARGADDVLRDSGTESAIPRCLQRFVRCLRIHALVYENCKNITIKIKATYATSTSPAQIRLAGCPFPTPEIAKNKDGPIQPANTQIANPTENRSAKCKRCIKTVTPNPNKSQIKAARPYHFGLRAVTIRHLTSRTQPRRTSDVNRESGTETANRRWLQ
jgi:hypothetical protein